MKKRSNVPTLHLHSSFESKDESTLLPRVLDGLWIMNHRNGSNLGMHCRYHHSHSKEPKHRWIQYQNRPRIVEVGCQWRWGHSTKPNDNCSIPRHSFQILRYEYLFESTSVFASNLDEDNARIQMFCVVDDALKLQYDDFYDAIVELQMLSRDVSDYVGH